MLGGQKETILGLFTRVKLSKLETILAGVGHSFNPTYHFLHPQVSVSLDPFESWGDYQRKEDGQTGKLEMAPLAFSPVQGKEGHSQTPFLLFMHQNYLVQGG